MTANQASRVCASNGMTLYDPTSSSLALNALVNFGKTSLGGSKYAEVHINGREGSKCKVFVGNGKIKSIPCTTGLNYVCEKKTPLTVVQCQSYTTSFNGNAYADLTGITSPQTCVYQAALAVSSTVVTVGSTVSKESIIAIDNGGTISNVYMPLDLADSFPNLNMILSSSDRIATLSYRSFKGLTKLKYIDLSHNSISSIDASVFKDAVNLIHIKLDGISQTKK
jgi:hypothetical protein